MDKFAGIVDNTMQKYSIPGWLKPYIFSYIKDNPINAVKQATSFIEIRRKKGEITRDHVKLPNGLTFDIGFVEEILSLFYYGEERIGQIYNKWSKEPGYSDLAYKERFGELEELSKKHLRAIRNLMEGIAIKPKPPHKEVIELFDYIESTKEWKDRVLASGLFIKYSFSYPFGFVFYKVFYPVAPEFMRSFGKTFTASDSTSWLEKETKTIITDGKDDPHIIEFAREMLSKVSKSITSELQLAKSNKVGSEVKLLRDISVAYPLHIISDLGVKINADKEAKAIIKR